MTDARRRSLAARVSLTIGSLLPYWRLLTFNVIYVTDDYFASDIFNGELPGRALIGQLLRHGQLPVWTSQLCSGMPLAGAPAEPIGLAAFTWLPPAAALDLFVIVLLLVAAHGAYGLARRFGADRVAAVLAGLAFAGSGYVACQLKHLGIISTIVWLPAGLNLLDRALAASGERAPSLARRSLWLALFGIVYAEQALCGFPQSAYICGLVYGLFALARLWINPRDRMPLRTSGLLLAGAGAAAILGAAAGAVVMLPLSAAGAISDRIEGIGYDWSTRLAYWPRNVLTFFVPYINGDISNNTYAGPPFFWEDYGYVGLATILLAFYAAVRARRRPVVAFLILLTLGAYLCVLGRATPVFHVVYLVVPGMKLFRFPTRFLFVVDLGIALLGAIGLTRLRADLARRWTAPSRIPAVVAAAICVLTALDLSITQPRQNPMVAAQPWLSPPPAALRLSQEGNAPRTFTPRHRDFHRLAFLDAHGWADVEPYFKLRDVLDPNTGGGFWNIASADCYAAIAPRWYVDLWGDHNRELSLMAFLTSVDPASRLVTLAPALTNVLRGFGVTHLLSLSPLQGAALPPPVRDGNAFVYDVAGASRVRVVTATRYPATDREAIQRLVDPDFNPDREVLIHDTAPAERRVLSGGPPGQASIVMEDSRHLRIRAESPGDGFLVLADTFYPGWSAEVDGTATPIYRANLAIRAIPLKPGRHDVRLEYEMPGLARGAQITLAAVSLLLLWMAGAVYAERRAAR